MLNEFAAVASRKRRMPMAEMGDILAPIRSVCEVVPRFVNIKSVAERKLVQVDAAPSVSFMKAPPGNDLKEYDGARHVRINDQWRLTFKWGESGPYAVLIEDPH